MIETETQKIASRVVKTPTGKMWLITCGKQLAAAEFEPRWDALSLWVTKRYGVDLAPGKDRSKEPALEKAVAALERYFEGKLEAPSRIEIAFDGSPLQRKIWQSVRDIPPGQTITYGQLATKARRTGAFRAAGAANGANRCAIFVPCHRVVAGSGALQGYGGGIDVKSWLLRHEGVENNGRRLGPDRSEA